MRDLGGDQYLKLHMANEDKLLKVVISDHISGHTTTSYIEEVKQLYYRVSLVLCGWFKWETRMKDRCSRQWPNGFYKKHVYVQRPTYNCNITSKTKRPK